jgi:hypothetical protein
MNKTITLTEDRFCIIRDEYVSISTVRREIYQLGESKPHYADSVSCELHDNGECTESSADECLLSD